MFKVHAAVARKHISKSKWYKRLGVGARLEVWRTRPLREAHFEVKMVQELHCLSDNFFGS